MKRLSTDSHANRGETRKNSQRPARAPHAKNVAFAFLVLCMFVVAVGTVPAQYERGRAYEEAQARKEREIQTCMRQWEVAYQQTVKVAQREKLIAERKADNAYRSAIRNDASDAARTAAKRAQREALQKAQMDLRNAVRDAQQIRQTALQSCRNPKPPETTNNNSGNNNSNNSTDSSARSCGGNNSSAGRTLGHGPRPRNPSVRMDLSVVDETGRPVRGVKTKLWSERQSNGLSCETIHTTDACGNVLMAPIHITKTLQLKLEARGFEPQMIQVEPSQLDKPFRAVMQAKRSH
jgi:hypothetical protein